MVRSFTCGATARCRSSAETWASETLCLPACASRCARSTAGGKTTAAVNKLKKKLRDSFIINISPSGFVFWTSGHADLSPERNEGSAHSNIGYRNSGKREYNVSLSL